MSTNSRELKAEPESFHIFIECLIFWYEQSLLCLSYGCNVTGILESHIVLLLLYGLCHGFVFVLTLPLPIMDEEKKLI